MKYVFNTTWRDLDPTIWSLAREARLGELRKVYVASMRNTFSWVGGWILLVWGVMWAILSTIAILSSFSSVLWVLPGLLLLMVGGYLLFPKSIYARWHVYLWEHGFLYEKGSLRQIFRWDQIESIQSGFAYTPRFDSAILAYKVRHQDGYEVTLNNVFMDSAELIKIIAEEFLGQVTNQELNIVPLRDKTFTQFKLDRQGISDKQETLSWQDIQELTIDKGTMAILKREVVLSDHELEHRQL